MVIALVESTPQDPPNERVHTSSTTAFTSSNPSSHHPSSLAFIAAPVMLLLHLDASWEL